MGPAGDTVAQARTEERKQGGDQGRAFHRGGQSKAQGFLPEPEERGPPCKWELRVGQGPAGTEHF